MQERDDIHFRISRRRLIQGGLGLGALVLIGAGANFLRTSFTSGSSPDLKIPILRSQEDENTDIARRFLEAVFAGNIANVYAFSHPEIKAQMDLPRFTEDIRDTIRKYSICNGSKLKKIEYSGIEGGDKRVNFELDPPCKGSIENRPALIKTVRVDLRRTGDGTYAPRYFSGPLEPIMN